MTTTSFQWAPGLAVRHGERTYRFWDHFETKPPIYVFRDVVTGELRLDSLPALAWDIRCGALQVANVGWAASPAARQFDLVMALVDLPARDFNVLHRSYRYLRAAWSEGITSQTGVEAGALLEQLAGFMPDDGAERERDPRPPSTAMLLRWLRTYETAQSIVMLILSEAGLEWTDGTPRLVRPTLQRRALLPRGAA